VCTTRAPTGCSSATSLRNTPSRPGGCWKGPTETGASTTTFCATGGSGQRPLTDDGGCHPRSRARMNRCMNEEDATLAKRLRERAARVREAGEALERGAARSDQERLLRLQA